MLGVGLTGEDWRSSSAGCGAGRCIMALLEQMKSWRGRDVGEAAEGRMQWMRKDVKGICGRSSIWALLKFIGKCTIVNRF